MPKGCNDLCVTSVENKVMKNKVAGPYMANQTIEVMENNNVAAKLEKEEDVVVEVVAGPLL